MKLFSTFALLVCFKIQLAAQGHYESKALSDANRMVAVYNRMDFIRYVDYLLPSEYDNDTSNKKGLAKMLSNDTSRLELVKLLKLSTVNGEQQAVFLHRFHKRSGYIVGVLKKGDKRWCFTQPLSQDVQFDLIVSMIPSINTAFAKLIDPRYGKRIKFNENQSIPTFHFKDINGDTLSSEGLIGKVLVFNFWSITCGPCIREIPRLNQLVETLKEKDVVFIAPAFYSPSDYLVKKFLPKYPFAYNIVEIINPDDYDIFVFPTHIVTDRNHTIIYKVASGNPDNVNKLGKVIKDALKE